MSALKPKWQKLLLSAALGLTISQGAIAAESLLNVSYDVSRELYKSINL